MNISKVFISYSWDNSLHKDWVINLMNRLRNEGVCAEIDISITQQGTINLNRMMLEKIRDSDFVIIVLTENYKDRAENYQGGVGLETTLLQNEILKNTKKIIPIKRSIANDNDVIPYYLKGLNYTDFSLDHKFEESFLELLHRIKGVDMIEVSPVGVGRELKPKKVTYDSKQKSTDIDLENIFNDSLPKLKEFTDIDKRKFMLDSFNKIKESLVQLCEMNKCRNKSFEYYLEDISNVEYSISFYNNGMKKRDIRLWYGNMLGGRESSIYISYDSFSYSKNSFNEMINCEIENGDLVLKILMSYKYKGNTINDIVKSIWENICLYLK